MKKAILTMIILLAGVSAGAADYILCTESAIAEGDYILVGKQNSTGKYFAMNDTCTSNQYLGITEVSINDNTISEDGTAIVWSISASSNGYYIQNGDNYLDDNATSSKNYARTVTTPTTKSEWTFEYNSTAQTWTILNVGATVKDTLSTNIGNKRVACYASIVSGNTCFYLYKKQATAQSGIANTQATAYTVSEAKDLIDAGQDLETAVYVKGTVSKIVTTWKSSTKTLSFDISADGSTSGQQFRFYKNQKTATDKYTTDPEIRVGDDVIGYGTMTLYNSSSSGSIYEFNTGNYLVEHKKIADFSIADIETFGGVTLEPEIDTEIENYSISYESNNTAVAYIENGKIRTTQTPGTATITATMTATGYKTSTSSFTVTNTVRMATDLLIGGHPTKTAYLAGESFDRAGLTASLFYNDGSMEDVTASATWSITPETLTAATTTVHVSATSGALSAGEDYDITVSKRTAHAVGTIEMLQRKTLALGAETTPADATVTYTVTDGADYVRIANTTLTATNEGTATIRAAYAGNEEYEASEIRFLVQVKHNETLFYESFDGCDGTGGNDGQWSGSIASSKLTADYGVNGAEESDAGKWTVVSGNGANKCAKYGAGSTKGSSTTPVIAFTGCAKLTFKAAAWNTQTEKTTLNITISNGNLSAGSVTLGKGAWSDYTIYITGVTESAQITFEASVKSNNRFFLDEVKVTEMPSEGTLTPVAQAGEEYYATFSNERAVEFTDNTTTVYAVGVNGETLDLIEIGNKQVAANTGVLIKSGTGSAAYTYIATAAAPELNLLKPGKGALTEGENCKFYRLAYYDYSAKTGLGFYYGPGCDNGQAFSCKAGTAYLAVPNAAGAPIRYLIGTENGESVTTGIEQAEERTAAVKVIRDGRIVILRGGKTYDTTGRVIR